MIFSENTNDFILELNEFSNNKIKNIYEVSYLYELNSNTEDKKLFMDIIFTAKYLNGLGKIMQVNLSAPANGNENGKKEKNDKIKEEYKNNIQHLINQLNFYMLHADDNFKKEFNNKFLSLNRSSLVNLTTLIYDLSWVKKFMNNR